MLRFQMVGRRDFIGEQLFTDGQFHEVAGILRENGTIDMWSRESGPTANFRWKMVPARTATANASPPKSSATPGNVGTSTDAKFCSIKYGYGKNKEEGERIIGACTRLIDAAKSSTGNAPADLAEWYYLRAALLSFWNHPPDRAAILSDLSDSIRLSPDFILALATRGVFLTEDHQIPSAINDFNRALSLSEKLPATNQLRDMYFAVSLIGRATAFAKLGNKEKARGDYEACMSQFTEWCNIMTPRGIDPDLAAAVSSVRGGSHAQTAYEGADSTYICNQPDSQEPMIITLSPRRKAFRLELNTASLHTHCTFEWVDGRFGNTMVKSEGFGTGCYMMAGINGDAQQRVQFSATSVTATTIQNGQITGTVKFEMSTGIFRGSQGAVNECHRAHG